MPTALITGASRGLGLALATSLAQRGWSLIIDARGPEALSRSAGDLRSAGAAAVTPLAGDITDPGHRQELAALVGDGLDLLVNNASILGPSPLPALAEYPLDALSAVYATNVIAPLGLTQLVLPALRHRDGAVVNISSDAGVEPYETWGGYGSSKAALDHWTAIFAAENPTLRVYAVDPGDMNTQLNQDAYPGEDVSDRADPASVVPALLHLIDARPPSGRYQASGLLAVGGR